MSKDHATSESGSSFIPSTSESIPKTAPSLTKEFILATASSVIKEYPVIRSAYLYGSYAKGTAREESDVDIAIFSSAVGWELMTAAGGVVLDLEKAFGGKEIDLSICPRKDSNFLGQIQQYWLKIDLEHISHSITRSSSVGHHTPSSKLNLHTMPLSPESRGKFSS